MTDNAYDTAIDWDFTWSGSPVGVHDPLQTFAMTVLAVHKQARLAGGAATVSRLRVVVHGDALHET